MLVYYVLLLIIFLGIYFEYNEKTFVFKGKEIKAKTIFFWIIYIYIMVLGFLRKPGFGVDFENYKLMYDEKAMTSLFNLVKDITSDNGFYILIWLTSKIVNDFQLFRLFVFACSFSLLSYVIYSDSKNVSLSYLTYLAFGFLGFDFCIMRQSIAGILCFYAFRFIEKKDFKKFFLFVILAMTFHKTAIVFLPLYPLIHNKFKIKPWIIKGSILIFAVLSAKFLLPVILKLYSNDYSSVLKTAQGGKLLILYSFLIFAVYILKRQINNKGVDILYHCVFGTIVFQATAPYFSELTRITKYFSLLFILLIPNVLYYYKLEKDKLHFNVFKKSVKVNCSVVTVLFCLLFTMLNFYMFKVNAEVIYPYNYVFDPDKDYWVEYEDGWKYENGLAEYSNQFKEIQNQKYYFDENGYRVTGWQKIKGEEYYFCSDGHMATNEYWDGKFINGAGHVVKQPLKHWEIVDGHKKYLAKGNSYLDYVTGLQKIDGEIYYFAGKGNMVTGFVTIQNDTYCFDDEGKALIGKHTINGDEYKFDTDGAAIVGVDNWRIYNLEGKLIRDDFAQAREGWYYTDSEGRFIVDVWAEKDGKSYYFGEWGLKVTGWNKIDKKWYYFDEDGVLLKDQNIDGWYVNEKGQRQGEKSKD